MNWFLFVRTISICHWGDRNAEFLLTSEMKIHGKAESLMRQMRLNIKIRYSECGSELQQYKYIRTRLRLPSFYFPKLVEGFGFVFSFGIPRPGSLVFLSFLLQILSSHPIDGCPKISGIAAWRAAGARRLVQFARRSISKEAMAPAHPQARAVRCPSRLSGLSFHSSWDFNLFILTIPFKFFFLPFYWFFFFNSVLISPCFVFVSDMDEGKLWFLRGKFGLKIWIGNFEIKFFLAVFLNVFAVWVWSFDVIDSCHCLCRPD